MNPAVAVEFVTNFDGEVASSQWMDPDTRYLRAGAIELLIRKTLAIREMGNAKDFCRRFDIDYAEFKEVMREDGYSVSSAFNIPKLARHDDDDLKWDDPKNKVWKIASDYAMETGNKVALSVFHEEPGRFGIISRFLARLGLGGSAIFTRYRAFHTWSRWDKVLFMSPCSKVRQEGNTFVMEQEYKSKKLVSVQEDMAGKALPGNFLNDSWELNFGTETRFLVDIYRTLTFQALVKSVRLSIKSKSFLGVILRFVDGIFEWIAYMIQMLFPFSIVGFLVLLLTCY